MTNDLARTPPGFVPTLTEVVQPAAAPHGATTVAAGPATAVPAEQMAGPVAWTEDWLQARLNQWLQAKLEQQLPLWTAELAHQLLAELPANGASHQTGAYDVWRGRAAAASGSEAGPSK